MEYIYKTVGLILDLPTLGLFSKGMAKMFGGSGLDYTFDINLGVNKISDAVVGISETFSSLKNAAKYSELAAQNAYESSEKFKKITNELETGVADFRTFASQAVEVMPFVHRFFSNADNAMGQVTVSMSQLGSVSQDLKKITNFFIESKPEIQSMIKNIADASGSASEFIQDVKKEFPVIMKKTNQTMDVLYQAGTKTVQFLSFVGKLQPEIQQSVKTFVSTAENMDKTSQEFKELFLSQKDTVRQAILDFAQTANDAKAITGDVKAKIPEFTKKMEASLTEIVTSVKKFSLWK